MDKFQKVKQQTEASDRHSMFVKAKEEINHCLKETNGFIFLGCDLETKEGEIISYGLSEKEIVAALFTAGVHIKLAENEDKE